MSSRHVTPRDPSTAPQKRRRSDVRGIARDHGGFSDWIDGEEPSRRVQAELSRRAANIRRRTLEWQMGRRQRLAREVAPLLADGLRSRAILRVVRRRPGWSDVAGAEIATAIADCRRAI